MREASGCSSATKHISKAGHFFWQLFYPKWLAFPFFFFYSLFFLLISLPLLNSSSVEEESVVESESLRHERLRRRSSKPEDPSRTPDGLNITGPKCGYLWNGSRCMNTCPAGQYCKDNGGKWACTRCPGLCKCPNSCKPQCRRALWYESLLGYTGADTDSAEAGSEVAE
jgi:hypothetical protein